MKMGIKTTAIASVLTLALMSGTAMAQAEHHTDSAPQQEMGGKKMQGKDQGMMGGKGMMMQGRMGCMKMMGEGMGMGMMGGGMMQHMSAENQQKFMDATKEMRKEMHMKRFEHMEAMRNPKTTMQELSAMEQKMLDSRQEMMKKAKTFQNPKN